MTGTSTHRRQRRNSWRERLFVLGGLALAALYTAASLATGTGTEAIGPLWMAGILLDGPRPASRPPCGGVFAAANWSAFGGYELDCGRDENFDWDTPVRGVRLDGRRRGARTADARRLTRPPSRRLAPPVRRRDRFRRLRPVRRGVPGGAEQLPGEPAADEGKVLRRVLLEGLLPLDGDPRPAFARVLARNLRLRLAQAAAHDHVGLRPRAPPDRGPPAPRPAWAFPHPPPGRAPPPPQPAWAAAVSRP